MRLRRRILGDADPPFIDDPGPSSNAKADALGAVVDAIVRQPSIVSYVAH